MRGRSRWTWFAVVMVLGMAFLWLGQSDVARASELGVQTEGSTVVGYDGEGGAVRIPDGITTISSNAFKGNNSITSVDLNEVTAIGSGAFQDSSLSSVSNMDGVIEVGDSAFANTKLKTITLPQTLKTLSQNAFRNTMLTSIEGGNQFLVIVSTNDLDTMRSHHQSSGQTDVAQSDNVNHIRFTLRLLFSIFICSRGSRVQGVQELYFGPTISLALISFIKFIIPAESLRHSVYNSLYSSGSR